jgi:SAM-dependent methyltransferase
MRCLQATQTVDDDNSGLIGEYGALIGEFAWHSLTVDPNLEQVSEAHYRYVVSALEDYCRRARAHDMKVLEVASYAHSTGYRLQQELGCDVTLFDISAKALQLGKRTADIAGLRAGPQLVAGDFHALPFEANSFDVVYIASAIHHTWKYETVISELQRVLAPGGLLMLLNEPCHRLCCFYGFRTSRPASFAKFENVLNDLGIIRTFGEPYLGSRPETLFGMIENQTIPLRRLLDLLNSDTKIIKLKLTPEDCMGDLEKSWLDNRSKGPDLLSGMIESTLTDRRAEAMKHFDEVAEGMQLQLPSPDQLQPFARRVARALCSLPPDSDQEAFRTALSEIFGAAVQVIAEKPNRQFDRPNQTLKGLFEKRDDVIYAFDDRISKILLHDRSLLPDLQLAGKDEIATFFPADYWQYTARNAEAGRPIATLGLNAQPGRFKMPGCGRKLLLVLRYYCVVPEHCNVRIRIQHLDRQLYLERIWQSESLLCVTLLPATNEIIELDLFREVTASNGKPVLTSGGLELAFVGVFQIE